MAARRLGDIKRGSESAFLDGLALRVALQEVRQPGGGDVAGGAGRGSAPLADERPPADEQLADKAARALLDEALAALPLDLRAALVLHELQGLEVRQIAAIEAIPVGTASSRLRRAREEFLAVANRDARPAPGARRSRLMSFERPIPRGCRLRVPVARNQRAEMSQPARR